MSINLFSPLHIGISLFTLILILVGIWQKQAVFSILDIFSVLSEGTEWASQLKTPEAVLEYIISHPQDVSLVAYEVGYSEQEIFYNSDIKRPLASTIKILVLAEYARQISQGLLAPQELVNIEDIDLYYLPGTDGDAHPGAIIEWKQKQYINSANQVELHHIPWAMIRYSDNAATDYLIQRLGRENLNNFIELVNIKNQDVPLPIIGQILVWSNHTCNDTFAERLQKYQAMSPQEYGNEVYRLTQIWKSDEEFRSNQLTHITSPKWLNLQEQQAMAHTLNGKGTANGYAQIMERIYRGLLISSEADRIMRRYLEWTMEFPNNQQQLDTFGAKNGSLAGIITEAWYLKPKNATNARVAALFLKISLQVHGLISCKITFSKSFCINF
ncbi:MAG: serine hydrolase [Calothrix sp. CSU_2_0]|nr:serine hydrolase [Calothrix sp. CSU_2_0]